MKWVKFRIKTVTEAEDIIISTLYDLGLEGAQIEDKVPLTAMEKEQMFVDILPDGPEDDGIAYLSFFVEEKEDGSLEVAGEKTTTEAVLADVKRELEDLRQFMDIGEASVAGATVDNVYLARGNTACRSATVHGHIAATDDNHVAFERRRFPFG